MAFFLAYRLRVVFVISLTAIASCGNSPPSFNQTDSDSSAISTDNGGDIDTDSDADTETIIIKDSDGDSETGIESDSSDLDSETGIESDSSDLDSEIGVESDSSDLDSETSVGSDSSCLDPDDHDEDGDGVDDKCDNCPSVANENQVNNGDNDALGDACEASGRFGLLDKIAVFEPFTDQGSDWNADLGKWSWLSDRVQGSAPGGDKEISGFFVHKTQLGSGAYAVEATFYHDQGGKSTDWSPFAGVMISWAKSGNARKFWTCLYEWDTRNMSIWRTLNGSIQLSTVLDDVDTSQYDTSIWRRIRLTWDGVGLTCEFENEIGDYDALTVPKQHIWKDMSGQAGLRVYNETSSFSSFVIYK